MVTPQQHEIDATLQSIRQKRQFVAALAGMLVTLGLITIGFLSGILKVPRAYAQGNTQIINADSSLNIVFTAASSNDAFSSADAGFDQNIGRCTASLQEDVVNFSLYHGYPGYRCTLVIGLVNQGSHAALLQSMRVYAPPGLQINAINIQTGSVLASGENIVGEFVILITPEAKENTESMVSIEMVFIENPDEQASPEE